VCFDQEERVKLIRRIDKLIFEEHPYALGWYSPHVRLLWWDRFGHPRRYFTKTGDERNVLSEWWYDAAKAKRLREAREAGTKLEQGEVEVAPWDDVKDEAAATGPTLTSVRLALAGCLPGATAVALCLLP
jgi:hypothetical protein